MSFFKDFKSDISQAMNELMPDGNEVFEDETPKTKKKSMNPLSKNLGSDLGLDDKTFSDVDLPNLDDIAPEDMLDQIDDLLNSELYSDEKTPDLLLDDDLEVNTMDMSVDDLLSQLSEKQAQNITDGAYDGSSIEEQEAVEDRDEVVNDEISADILGDIIADENKDTDNPIDNSDDDTSEEDTIGDASKDNDDVPETNSLSLEDTSDDNTIFSEDTNNNSENITESDDIQSDNTITNESNDMTEFNDNNVNEDNSVDNIKEEAGDTSKAIDDEDPNSSDVIDKLKEEDSVENKDVISINSTEQKNDRADKSTPKASSERSFNINDADTETTYITKGTRIKGDIDIDGSIDIIGSVDGNVTCQAKVVVGGTVNGNITAGELYANGARIEGDVKSFGSVKVGVGSMIIGSIEGESAVIAGAVNGEIDVKGPVIVDSTAVIMGNIKSRSVQINNGAVIEGFCSQSYSDIDVKSFFA